jgi:hypothetical protein
MDISRFYEHRSPVERSRERDTGAEPETRIEADSDIRVTIAS